MSKPKTTNPNAIVRPRMLASTRDRLQELSAELSEDSYEGQRLVIEMAERAAVHMRDARISKNLYHCVQRENKSLKVKLEFSQSNYSIAEDGRLKALDRLLNSERECKEIAIIAGISGLGLGVALGYLITAFL